MTIRRTGHQHEEGYVLMAATVFTFVLLLGGIGLFSVSSREFSNAFNEHDNWQAFYLAEAAVERGRTYLVGDSAWRDGWLNIALGNGAYSLTLVDTTTVALGSLIKLTGYGSVGKANRSVEMYIRLSGEEAFQHAVFALGVFDRIENVCLTGKYHKGGGINVPDPGCPAEVSVSTATPPPIYTDAVHFPNSTYYQVLYQKTGTVEHVQIHDRNGVNITSALGDSLVGYVKMKAKDSGTYELKYEFKSATVINYYFNDITGIFKRELGDTGIVVDFGGEPLVMPPVTISKRKVKFDAKGSSLTLHTTIITTRFTGISEQGRLISTNWTVDDLSFKDGIILEPYNGITSIAYKLKASKVLVLGTASWPALTYVIDKADLKDNTTINGTIISLNKIKGGEDPLSTTIVYNSAYEVNLPPYLKYAGSGNPGAVTVLGWRGN